MYQAWVTVIGEAYIYRRPGLVPGTFNTTHGFSYTFGCFLVPRLRGDDDKKETRMTEVVDGDDGKEEAGVSVIGGSLHLPSSRPCAGNF